MKIYAKITDSRGKTEGKGDDSYLEVLLNKGNANRFLIAFDGDGISLLDYGTGRWYIIEYGGTITLPKGAQFTLSEGRNK